MDLPDSTTWYRNRGQNGPLPVKLMMLLVLDACPPDLTLDAAVALADAVAASILADLTANIQGLLADAPPPGEHP